MRAKAPTEKLRDDNTKNMFVFDQDLIQPCDVYWWGGFYVPVRNNWSHSVERRHLTAEQKEIYMQTFGQSIITDREFDQWISKLLQEGN